RRRRAAVDRADVPVIADDRRPVHTGPSRDVARLDAVARIAVVALRVGAAAAGDRRVRAHVGRRIADIARAHYPVVTGRRRAAHAGSAARITGLEAVAEDAVVAHHWLPYAASVAARVAGRALVVVIAGGGVVRVDAAPRCGIAAIVGAGVAVVAVGRRAADAEPAAARVVGGAGVAIATGGGIVHVEAAGGRVAAVVGANVVVVAIEAGPTHAGPVAAGVVRGAGVVVGAGGGIGRVDTAALRVAGVVGADVAVVAVQWRSTRTNPVQAGVGGGAGVAVVTGRGVVPVDTTLGGAARLVGARVAVLAVRPRA